MKIKKIIASLGLLAGLFVMPTKAMDWDWDWFGSGEPEEKATTVTKPAAGKPKEGIIGNPKFFRPQEKNELLEGWSEVSNRPIPKSAEEQIRKAQEQGPRSTGKKALDYIAESDIAQETKGYLKQKAKEKIPEILAGAGTAGAALLAGLVYAGYDRFKNWLSGSSENEKNAQKQETNKQGDGNISSQLINNTSTDIKAVLSQLNTNSLEDIRLKNIGAVSSFNDAITASNWNKAQAAITTLERSMTSMKTLIGTVVELAADIKSVKKFEPNNSEFNTLVAELNDTIKEKFDGSQVQELLKKTETIVTDLKNRLNKAQTQSTIKPTTEEAGGEMVPEPESAKE